MKNQLNTIKIKDTFEMCLDFWIQNNLADMPDLLDVHDLLDLGIFSSRAVLKNANCKKIGPDYFLACGKCRYRKEDVLDYIKQKALKLMQKRRPDDETNET